MGCMENEEIKVPSSWSEVTIGQFSRLRAIPEGMNPREKSLHAVAILVGAKASSIRKMDAMEYLKLNERLKFAASIPTDSFRREIEIDGVTFGFLPDLAQLTIAEVIDLETYAVEWDRDLSKIMAILYRPIKRRCADGSYEVDDYGESRADLRSKLFEERMSAQDAYGASLFFSLIAAACLTASRPSSGQSTMARTMMTS